MSFSMFFFYDTAAFLVSSFFGVDGLSVVEIVGILPLPRECPAGFYFKAVQVYPACFKIFYEAPGEILSHDCNKEYVGLKKGSAYGRVCCGADDNTVSFAERRDYRIQRYGTYYS